MKYFNQTTEQQDTSADINMSPLIDMVFLLLIFFMVTTVFVQETGVEINRPQASTAEALAQNSILVALTQEGEIFHANTKLTNDQLQSTLHDILATRQLPVIILADENAPAGLLVKLIDCCKLAGATNVAVSATR